MFQHFHWSRCGFSGIFSLALMGLAFTVTPAAAQQQPVNACTKKHIYRDQPAPPLFVKMETNMGDMVLELNCAQAPRTVINFMKYVEDKHYEGTIFHRVMENFMIQGGGFTPDMKQKPTNDPIRLETPNGLKNQTYTVAMARTAAPHSATSQFFINVVNNRSLDAPKPDGYGYTVFGKVVLGQSVVDKIKKVAVTNNGMHQHVPLDPVIIKAAYETNAPTEAEKQAEKAAGQSVEMNKAKP